jgi:NTP pyrophosphatase (non-canonical NTP hydrolase)
MPGIKPKVVCLCGSTRFYAEFQLANYQETMAGRIVLSVGFYPHAQRQAHGEDVGCTEEQKQALDELHKRKIDLADEVLVLNVGGYIGSSTRSELEYAESIGLPIRYLEPIPAATVSSGNGLTFAALREVGTRRWIEWAGRKPELDDLLFCAVELGGEAGEVLNKVKKFARGVKGMRGSVSLEATRTAVAEELADVIICCDRVAAVLGIDLGIDLGIAVPEKFNETSVKNGLSVTMPIPVRDAT